MKVQEEKALVREVSLYHFDHNIYHNYMITVNLVLTVQYLIHRSPSRITVPTSGSLNYKPRNANSKAGHSSITATLCRPTSML